MVLISTRKKLLLLRLKEVDEGLTSLYLHYLGIETMPVHRQHSLFKSILHEVAVSFSSSSLKRCTTLAGVEYCHTLILTPPEMTYLQDFHQVKISTQSNHSSIWYLIEDAQKQESSGKGSINTRISL